MLSLLFRQLVLPVQPRPLVAPAALFCTVEHGQATLGDVLAAIHVIPDFEYTRPVPDTNLFFVHRKLTDGDIYYYYVDNRNDRYERVGVTFRVVGKAPSASNHVVECRQSTEQVEFGM